MFLELPTKDYSQRYALYRINDYNQRLLHMGVVPLSLLTKFEDMKELPQSETIFLTVIETNVDRLKLANKALLLCHEKGREDLKQLINEAVEAWSAPVSPNAIRCVQTGEVFDSAAACAEQNDLTYNQLIRHLNGVKSYNSVKGLTYERVN